MHPQQTAFENVVGKEEIAHNKQFLLFPQCFYSIRLTVSPFVYISDIISLFAAELEELKIATWGKEFNIHRTIPSFNDPGFFPFPTMFSNQLKPSSIIWVCGSTFCCELKVCRHVLSTLQ